MSRYASLACVLFDLDGTLLDTAPDLIAALNRTLVAEGVGAVDPDSVKPYISHGASAMVTFGLGNACTDDRHRRLLERMLDEYLEHIADETRLFAGMADVLETLENRGLKWGIITNKRARFTDPLLRALDLHRRCACIISGDTTTNSKPHPEPMLAACARAGCPPERCVYIGDAARDIEAGKGVGMGTLAAAYGYIPADDNPEDWGADAVLAKPLELLRWMEWHD